MEKKGQKSEANSGRNNRRKNLEIERKFIVSANAERKIAQAGGNCVLESTFTDTYFDSHTFSLTLADHWLRRRNGVWELKAPQPESGKEINTGKCTRYLEITSEPEIISLLSAILSPDPVADSEMSKLNTLGSQSSFTLEEWIGKHALTPFAEFRTHRKSYSMNDGITVVLDEADFGFSVGEIEMMIEESKESVTTAVATIDQMAEKLGVRTGTIVPGKMSAYLKKFAPRHYEALLIAGVLQR